MVMAASVVASTTLISFQSTTITSNSRNGLKFHQFGYRLTNHCSRITASLSSENFCNSRYGFRIRACLLPSSSSSSSSSPRINFSASTRLYVSGLSFRTTRESLINAFENFGKLVEVNLVMDKIANRPRGFAFLRYATEEESKKAIEEMHGKLWSANGETCTAISLDRRKSEPPQTQNIFRVVGRCAESSIAPEV